MYKRFEKINLRQFVPSRVINNKDSSKSYEVRVIEDEYLSLAYEVPSHNQLGLCGKRNFDILLPKHIKRNRETFEVIGLLQAEMGKKQDGKITFCNHEYQLVNKVMNWFENQFDFSKKHWKWYIKVNINEPENEDYKKEVEEKIIKHWIKKSGLPLEQSYPTKVSYIKHTDHKKLKFYDYGTLIIEKKSNLFSQVIKKLVKDTTQSILEYKDHEIRDFMRGIIAGEACVEIHEPSKKYRVHISANDSKEKLIFHECLNKLGVGNKIYKHDKLIVSKKHNNLELLKQQLMTLSPKKYNKFLNMMNRYEYFDDLKLWRYNLQYPQNKIPDQVIEEIKRLHYENPSAPAWKIAQMVDYPVSEIKVQRVRRALRAESSKPIKNVFLEGLRNF